MALTVVPSPDKKYRDRCFAMESHLYESERLVYALVLAMDGLKAISEANDEPSQALASLAYQVRGELKKAIAILEHGEARVS